MSPEQWQRVKFLFDALVEQSAAERAARLRSEPDAEISAAVEKLLAAVANLAYLWNEDQEINEVEKLVGKRVGNYTIEREIGRGGMGIVFEARRAVGDFSQSVALKLLKRGMDSAAMLRRFRSDSNFRLGRLQSLSAENAAVPEDERAANLQQACEFYKEAQAELLALEKANALNRIHRYKLDLLAAALSSCEPKKLTAACRNHNLLNEFARVDA